MINNHYLSHLKQLGKSFISNKQFPHITLYDFFEDSVYRQFKDSFKLIPFKPEANLLSHSYSLISIPNIFKKCLHSSEFHSFIFSITGHKIKSFTAKIYCFKTKDYQIINDDLLENNSAEIIIDLTDIWNPNWGGYISYTDGKGNTLLLPVKKNSVTIIQKKSTVNRFIKYVNHHAGSNKRIFCIVKLIFV